MASRRQERMARLVTEAVSDAITNHLNDPRIVGFVSVTHVDVPADMRRASVYLSIMGKSKADQRKTFNAIEHARSRIQSLLAKSLSSKFCPSLRFYMDENFRKTMETMRLISEAAEELNKKDSGQIQDAD